MRCRTTSGVKLQDIGVNPLITHKVTFSDLVRAVANMCVCVCVKVV